MQGFQELTFIILIASVVSIFVHYIRQPLIIGYIISGVLAGHYFLDIIKDGHSIELFSKLGIVILLFTIGLHLNPNTLKEAGRDSFFGGIAQVFVSACLGFLVSFYLLSLNLTTSIFVGIALAFSSTIVVLKIFSDKGEVDKLYSKISIGILLVQDIISAIILLSLSIFNQNDSSLLTNSTSILITTFVIKAAILLILYFALRKFILQRLATLFASSQETLLLFGLGSGFVMAYLFYKFGFSLEIGALFAGVAIASSNFAKEISSRLKPLQDFFIAMFFVLLGANLVVENIYAILPGILIFTLFVIIFKLLIVFFIMNLLGHRTRTSFYTAVSLTQVSEFSLIMLSLALSYGYVSQNISSMMTIVAMISMAISAYMMVYVDRIYTYLRNIFKRFEIRKNNFKVTEGEADKLDAIIFGFDRIGHEFVEVFDRLKYKYLVIDINPKYIEKAIEAGISSIYGDAEDIGFLEENNILNTKMMISTIPSFRTNLSLAEAYRKRNQEGILILIAHDEDKARDLYEAGASYVIMPYHLGAYHAGRMLMEFKNNPEIFNSQKELQFKRMTGEVSAYSKKHLRTKRKKIQG
jgi:Kef-type K+ transport system membrane component KefB